MNTNRFIFRVGLALCALFPCMGQAAEVLIENEQLLVAVNPLGAELMRIHYKPEAREYLWNGAPEHWGARAPIMFPVNVRFRDERFTYKGKEFSMPRMGLAVAAEFRQLESERSDEAVFEFRSTPEITNLNYPFPFVFTVKYSLKENRLINTFVVTNEGDDVMYFALGGHPGIACPIAEGVGREDYQISFFEETTASQRTGPLFALLLIQSSRGQTSYSYNRHNRNRFFYY